MAGAVHRVRYYRGRRERKWGLIFSTPAIAVLLVFSLMPILYGLAISLYQYNLITPAHFVGLANYVNVLSDASFLQSLLGTAFYVFATVVPVWMFSFGIALLLLRAQCLSSLWKTVIFIPSVIPFVSVALLWTAVLSYNGPLNYVLSLIHVPPIPWLTSEQWAPWALVFMSWWQATSYYTFLFLAGLLAMPQSPLEAAAIDGANEWQRLRFIMLPLLKRTIFMVVVISILNGLQTFVFQDVVTQGGPGTATQIVSLLVYRTAFEFLNMGNAAAMSVVLFVLTLAFSLLQFRLFREEEG